MPRSIPIRIRDLDRLLFHAFLLFEPFLAESFSFEGFLSFTVSIGKEGRVDRGVFEEFWFFRRGWLYRDEGK